MPKDTTKRKTKETGKRKKDPNAPKRGLSAYMFFAQEQRESVRNENPDVSFGQIGKILGEKWSKLSDKAKTKYENKAKEDKERYEREKAEYQAES